MAIPRGAKEEEGGAAEREGERSPAMPPSLSYLLLILRPTLIYIFSRITGLENMQEVQCYGLCGLVRISLITQNSPDLASRIQTLIMMGLG